MLILKLLAWIVLIFVGGSTIADYLKWMRRGRVDGDWIDQLLTSGGAVVMILIYLGAIWIVSNGGGC